MSSGIFKDITLISSWNEKKYIIPSDKVMGAIACVEQHVTLHELYLGSASGAIKLATLAAAYAAVLTYAGAKDADQETIYASMFGLETGRDAIFEAIRGLLVMMIPPQDLNKDETPGKANRQIRQAVSSLSKKRT